MALSEHTTTVFNKILIPVLTTVLGATAIYFLGFNKKSGRSDLEKMLITKEATVKAWKSFVTTQNISFKNIASISKEYGGKITNEVKQAGNFSTVIPSLDNFKDELLRESAKSTKDMEDIVKEEDIDAGFVSMLNRAIDNAKDTDKKLVAFFKNLIGMLHSDQTDQEKAVLWEKEFAGLKEMGDNIDDRAATEAEGISKSLTEKYNQPFDLNELLLYVEYKNDKKDAQKENGNKPVNNDGERPAPIDPNNNPGEDTHENDPTPNNTTAPTTALLIGQWGWEMAGGELELNNDGKMYWSFGSKGYTSGAWKLLADRIQMNLTNPDTQKKSTITGFISDFNTDTYTLTFFSTPKEIYHFRRKN